MRPKRSDKEGVVDCTEEIEVSSQQNATSVVSSRTARPVTLTQTRPQETFELADDSWISNLAKLTTESKIDYQVVYQECIPARDNLLATSNKYRQKLKLPPLTLTATHSWTEVERELQTACSSVEAAAGRDKELTGSVGKLRRAFRTLCQHASAGQTFVSLVPNDVFGFSSILCGGLKAIFTGLYQTALYREEVYRVLEDLPYILTDHSVPLNVSLYNNDEELHRRTAALYVSVYKLVEHLLNWFIRNTFVTKVKLLVDPTGFSDRLKEKIAEVKVRAQRWERRTLRLSMQNQNDSLQLQYWNAFAQNRIDRNVETILCRTEELEDKMSRGSILETFDSFLHALASNLEKRKQQSLPSKASKSLPSSKPRRERNKGAKIADILQRFLYEPELVPTDCAAVARYLKPDHYGRTQLDGSRIAALQTSSRIHAWLIVDESSLLLLNGRTKPIPQSETSAVSAQIVTRLLDRCQSTEQVGASDSKSAVLLPLAFFCGQHCDWQRDPNGSPAEVAMSLLLQLLDHHGSSLPADVLKRCRDGTTPFDIASICASLGTAIGALGRRVIVVLVVDGIKFFTNPPERQEQMRELIAGLVTIYRDYSGGATLKFLFSSPTRSGFIEDLFEDDEILVLPRDLLSSDVDASHDRLPHFPSGDSDGEDEISSDEESGSNS